MKIRTAFTMIELIFVIIIIGIIGKFGVEFMTQAYSNFLHTSINERLQSNSTYAVEFISKRLENRIKQSTIVKDAQGDFNPIHYGDNNNSDGAPVGDGIILEWIGADVDGFRGNDTLPNWSGIIDIDPGVGTNILTSPDTNTTGINSMLAVLSTNGTTLSVSGSALSITDPAIFFVGAPNNSDTRANYGWSGIGAMTNQNTAMLRVQRVNADITQFTPASGTLANVEVYEYYKFAWTAYAIEFDQTNSKLWLHYDYQPWTGEDLSNGNKELIMDNVTTFRFTAVNTMIKIQVCVGSDLIIDKNSPNNGYSMCREKTIF